MSRHDTDSTFSSPALARAAGRLAVALDTMEARLPPLLGELSQSRTRISESAGMATDRAQLAARLDTATARAQSAEAELGRLRADAAEREARIDALADRTRAELDGTIATLKDVISRG